MRTTLKRGLGRADGGGNGRPVLPPDALAPMRRYRQAPPPRRSGWQVALRVLGWAFAAIVMVAVALVAGVYLWLHESIAATSPHSRDVKEAAKYVDKLPPPDKAAIALVIGYDRRHGESATTPSRSDTVMLVRADPQTKSISMLSFPRDMVVTITCPGISPYRARINEAYSRCGSKGTVETIRNLTKLPINYLITVNFRGFKKVVNTLGGVWVDVDRRYFNDNSGLGPGYSYATINLKPGYQRLTGGAALDFVRYRHTDSDFYRVARQQLFVTAMKEQFRRNFSFTKIPKLVNAVTQNVEIAVGGGKDLDLTTVRRYAEFVYALPPGHFFQARIDGLTGYSELYTDPARVEEAVQEFVTPDIEAPRVATAVALGRKLKTKAPKPEETTLVVLNGNGREGSGATAGYLLGRRGYRVITPPSGATGNAPWFDYFHTKVYFDPRQKGAAAAALQAAKLFGAAETEPFPAQARCHGPAARQPRGCLIRPLSNGAMLTVVVGSTFHGTIAPAPPRREIRREPPNVVYDKAATESLLESVQKKVPFRLMVPTVIESSSIPDPEMPIRAYRIQGGHRAVRLVFRTGGGQYWGVQQTTWDDAPILDDRNSRHVLKGRVYDFYYHGPRLHMIVLREKGATYWVVNTLLDQLSNETMIAIAKGLRPLGEKPKPRKRAKAPKRAEAKE